MQVCVGIIKLVKSTIPALIKIKNIGKAPFINWGRIYQGNRQVWQPVQWIVWKTLRKLVNQTIVERFAYSPWDRRGKGKNRKEK